TVQINWHDKQPIFSVDFDHSDASAHGYRFATGGGDNNVRIWRLRADAQVEFLASLNRHTAPVNVVRFSPCAQRLASAGDDGVVIIWRPADGAARLDGAAQLDGGDAQEAWRPAAMLRGSLADICDLAWSPDGAYIASASVDNTTRIWDARDSRCVQVLADHTHYVQGVAWDPCGQFLATQSSDRTLRVYRWAGGQAREMRAGADAAKLAATHASIGGGEGARQRVFLDDSLASFFRRPSVSPDGRLLAAAAGVQRGAAARNACLVWARDRLCGEPVLRLGGHARPVVATRWAPCEFEPSRPGWLAGAPRMMLAVATQSCVAIYDTEQPARAVALADRLHYAAITDLAWTRDGSHVVVVSIDGFASVVALDQPTPARALRRPEPLPEPLPAPARAPAAPPASAGARKRLAPTLVSTL
ncbi:Chromatin assembly factor 1 subunit, partial [Coemansia sp. RSA 2708]